MPSDAPARGSLRARVYTVAAVCVVPALIGSIVALVTLGIVERHVTDLDRHSVVPLATLGDLRDMEGDTRVEVWQYLAGTAATRPALATQITATDGQADADVQAYLAAHGSRTDDRGRQMLEFAADLTAWRGIRDTTVFPLAVKGDLAGAYSAAEHALAAANETMAGPLDGLYEAETTTSAAKVTASNGDYRTGRTINLSLIHI